MKLQQSLIGLFLLVIATCAQAAPDKPNSLDDLVMKVSAGNNKEAAQSEAAGDLLLQAMSLLGVAYRFGGSTPSSGLDCSGFIQYIFKKSLKINMPRTSSEMARTGKAIDRDELAPGDLVFFNTRGFANSHVGLYMGNGKFIHSPRTGKSVEVVNMNSTYWSKRYNGARRVNRTSMYASEPAPVKKQPEPKVMPAVQTQERATTRENSSPTQTTSTTKRSTSTTKKETSTSAKGKSTSNKNNATSSKSKNSTKKTEQDKNTSSKSSTKGKSSKEKENESTKNSKKKNTTKAKAEEEKKSSSSKKSSSTSKNKEKSSKETVAKKKTTTKSSDKKKN